MRESPFHIVNCFKSFDFKLFFVYTLNLLKAPLGTFSHEFSLFLQTFDLIQNLLNVALK